MEDESKEYLALNTHKGLYRLNRLAFGVASAPAIWQRSMDQLLQGIPDTHCILDDILITGVDDEHRFRQRRSSLAATGRRWTSRQPPEMLFPAAKDRLLRPRGQRGWSPQNPSKSRRNPTSTRSSKRQPATQLPGTGQLLCPLSCLIFQLRSIP